jgi:putative hydrolase of the HAD superfamily
MDAIVGIGFDLDHTLAIDNRLERVAFLRLLDLLLEEGGRTVGTLADEIESVDALLSEQRAGAFSIEEAVRRFVAERGLEPSDAHVTAFRRTAVDMVDEFVVPLPGARRTLGQLRERGVAVAVLSNGWNPLQIKKAEQAGFFGTVLVSAEIGERKPSAGAFESLLRALGTQPQHTWYVGDDPHGDVAGAQDAGMHAIWINWEKKAYPPGLRPPGHTIAALDELPALLPIKGIR